MVHVVLVSSFCVELIVVPVSNCEAAKRLLGSSYKAGIYNLTIAGRRVATECDKDGWTVIQKRGQHGNPMNYFYREWDQYVNGFGVPGKNLKPYPCGPAYGVC